MSELEGAEPVTSTCPGCGKVVTTYWMRDNTGCISRPEYVLVADCVYHSECWDDLVKKYPVGET